MVLVLFTLRPLITFKSRLFFCYYFAVILFNSECRLLFLWSFIWSRFYYMFVSVFTARIYSRVKIFINLIVITLTVTAGGIEFIKTFVLRPTELGLRKITINIRSHKSYLTKFYCGNPHVHLAIFCSQIWGYSVT